MRSLFQILGLKQGNYDRPNQPWICGHAGEGRPCPLGPDRRGHCRAAGECTPRRQGDRWHCTRLEEFGGACPKGPNPDGACGCPIPPCQPVRSLRSRRGLITVLASLLTIGLLLLVLGSSTPEPWINPGNLTAAHATSAMTCADCHGTDKLHGPWSALAGSHPVKSELCLNCHDLGHNPLSPHGQFANKLERMGAAPTAQKIPDLLLGLARKTCPADMAHTAVECTACHQEHLGREADLRSMTDRQCQVCHRATFNSFADGHPEFLNYPYRTRTHIIFDHSSHLLQHFQESSVRGKAPTSCLDCHTPAGAGGKMLVKDFATTCAACHEAQIEGEGCAGPKGIAFLRVPGLDVKSLVQHGRAIGQWPEFADGPIGPYLRLLLANDPVARDNLAALQGIDLGDLSTATNPQLDAAASLAWRIKLLFSDLTTGGQTALLAKLGPDFSAQSPRGSLVGQLTSDTLLAAQAAWWPALPTEIANYRKGVLPALPAPPAPKPQAIAPATTPPAASSGDDDLLASSDKPTTPKPAPTPAAAGDDLLAEPATPAAPPPTTQKSAPAEAGDDLLAGPEPTTPAASTPAETSLLAPQVEASDPEAWVSNGGWYRDDATYTLYYRPGGHADAFLTAWLDAAGRSGANPATAAAAALVLRDLSDPKAPGLCAKCHSIDTTADGTHLVQWHAPRPDPLDHPATKFNHSAHFSLLSEQGCETCHVLNPKADYMSSFTASTPPGHFQSNFKNLPKATCSACHQASVAGQSCQLCHNYHTGTFAVDRMAKTAASNALRP
ncbi:MAG TPA: cytochrome c3 family protein [Opitutaceae bacterium]|jgi:predicted CXXCH cytochrome family protein|nr:cytochrome c3 family protein [Opitutaceae bacterium]